MNPSRGETYTPPKTVPSGTIRNYNRESYNLVGSQNGEMTQQMQPQQYYQPPPSSQYYQLDRSPQQSPHQQPLGIQIQPIENIITKIDCRNIMEHIESCKMCRKIYKRDNRLITIIVGLVLFIMFLLTKILDK